MTKFTHKHKGYTARVSDTGSTRQYYGNDKTGRHYTYHADGSANKHTGKSYGQKSTKHHSKNGTFNDK